MKWEGNRESDNVEDRRDAGPSGGGGFPIGGRGIGLGTIVIALLGGWVLGVSPLTLLGLLSGGVTALVGAAGGRSSSSKVGSRRGGIRPPNWRRSRPTRHGTPAPHGGCRR